MAERVAPLVAETLLGAEEAATVQADIARDFQVEVDCLLASLKACDTGVFEFDGYIALRPVLDVSPLATEGQLFEPPAAVVAAGLVVAARNAGRGHAMNDEVLVAASDDAADGRVSA